MVIIWTEPTKDDTISDGTHVDYGYEENENESLMELRKLEKTFLPLWSENCRLATSYNLQIYSFSHT